MAHKIRQLCLWSSLNLVAWAIAAGPSLRAQAPARELAGRLRAAARSVPGTLPTSLHYVKFAEASSPRSALVEGADSGLVVVSFPVFQIRYPDRWIVVDAGFDRRDWTAFYGSAPVSYWPERWDTVRTLLRGASTVVLTHEHWDHAAGVERGSGLGEIAAHTALTPSQLASLLDPPAPIYVALRRDSVPAYRRLGVDTLHALAPGVVLLAAPGHSPGSQWVYVRLASGREFLLVGDLVWNAVGLERQSQRPRPTSESLKEDRDAVRRQLQVVRALADSTGLVIVPSHDDALLATLARSGALQDHADLSRRP